MCNGRCVIARVNDYGNHLVWLMFQHLQWREWFLETIVLHHLPDLPDIYTGPTRVMLT